MKTDREWNRRAPLLLFACVAATADAATVSLMAVQRNGNKLIPVNTIAALPGDTIEAEFFVSDWGDELPTGIRSFEFRLAGKKSAVSGPNGEVVPLGWSAEVLPPFCTGDVDCAEGEVCQSFCVQPDHDPSMGGFIDRNRPDYLLLDFTPIAADVSTVTLDFTYFGVVQESDGAEDTGEAKYAGTLILTVSPTACGTFRYGFVPCGQSILASPTQAFIVPHLVPLTIQLPECPVLPIGLNPPVCAIDARIPHIQGSARDKIGWQSAEMFFDDDPAGLSQTSFRTRVVPEVTPPGVSTVLPGTVATSLHLNLTRIIDVQAWTCIEHRASEREGCISHLPGDSNQDLITDQQDILDLRANLINQFGPPPMALFQCDIDRSQRCAPLDLLMAVDLQNGSGFNAWSHAELAHDCPSSGSLVDRQPRGACCNLVLGGCFDNALQEECSTANLSWVQDAACCDAPCAEPTGSCCDLGTGLCRNDVLESNCSRLAEVWNRDTTCAQVTCIADRGACCNWDSGFCVDNLLRSQCTSPSSTWSPGHNCSQIFCGPR